MSDFFNIISSSYHQLSDEFFLPIITMSYLLVFAAEIGDKSQLVCMVLAARFRGSPVALGAIAAFVFLNSLAVTVGITITQLVEPKFISIAVALMFLLFGVQSFKNGEEDTSDVEPEMFSAKRLVLTTFILITIAEFGDKTQLAVIALSSYQPPFSVWLGSTAALISTTLLGIWAGRTVLQKIPLTLLHQASGVLFIVLGLAASFQAYRLFLA